MAGTTHYQKLSLQLDAENKKLKDKLNESKKQISDLKKGTSETAKGFKQSFGEMGGAAGDARDRIGGLISSVSTLHPAILGMAAVGAAAGAMFQDLTAYTSEWDGAMSDAGRTMKGLSNGMKTFWEEASEARGKALAEGGLWGWLKEAADQVTGLTTGVTQATMGMYAGMEKVANDLYITWQNGILNTMQRTAQLKASTKELLNIARSKDNTVEERNAALEKYRALAYELRDIEKTNSENELAYLSKIKDIRGGTLEDLMAIENAKVGISDAEREYQELLGSTIRLQNQITAELDKQTEARRKAAVLIPELKRKDLEPGVKAMDLQDEIKLNKDLMAAESARMTKAGTDAESLGKQLKEIRASSIKGLIAEGIAAVISKALSFLPPPFSLVAAGTAAAGAMALFNKLIPSFAVGTDYVPNDMLAMIHKGEAIIPAAQNKNRELVAVVRGQDLHFIMSEYDRRRANTF